MFVPRRQSDCNGKLPASLALFVQASMECLFNTSSRDGVLQRENIIALTVSSISLTVNYNDHRWLSVRAIKFDVVLTFASSSVHQCMYCLVPELNIIDTCHFVNKNRFRVYIKINMYTDIEFSMIMKYIVCIYTVMLKFHVTFT